MPIVPKRLVFPGISKYFLYGFPILLGLLLKPPGLGEELNFASNPSGFRNNPSRIANPDRKYLETLPKKTYIWTQVALFVR